MEYVKGRTNLSATIFVPYDCNNNCSFCTSKQDYKDTSSFNLMDIVATIKRLNHNDLIQSYVITGGEPLANVSALDYILVWCDKPVYINTTLPINTLNESIDLINITDKIKGVNISRHINSDFPCVATIKDIDRIYKSVRINSVLPYGIEKGAENYYTTIHSFINKYGKKKRDINFRADYRYITLETLKSLDSVSTSFAQWFDYFMTESCLVCNSEHYSMNDQFIVSYHRGLESSCIAFGSKCYVNDVIVKQDGNVYKDWNCILDEDFNKWILK